MKQVQVAIVGGGVSGLYAADLLEQAGVDYLLIEGREQAGGRIQSLHAVDKTQRFDLGATWVWPAFQTQLAQLLPQLGVELIAQEEQGDMLLERALHQPISRHPGYVSSPPSMRVAGGMRVLIEKLQQRLNPAKLLFSHLVTEIQADAEGINLSAQTPQGESLSVRAGQVFLALPPALAAGLNFTPALPDDVAREWATTGTWMAAHAKYVAVYRQPFWRQQGLSGEARSAVGPMAEIHDASASGQAAALFGFLGIPAKTRWTTSESNLKKLCRAQLVRLFGEQAAHPVAEFFKDWADDPLTATAGDLTANPGHSIPEAFIREGVWRGRLQGIASEWSAVFPGYIAGAIDAATQGFTSFTTQSNPITKGAQYEIEK
jgi:monoamine oxidase